MAANKKSFLLYCDIIHTVKKLNDEQAGRLIKIILSYVNDENPTVDDILIDLVFEPIKQQLKRDLRHWESVTEKRKESGRLGGIKSGEIRKNEANEANASTVKQNEANEAVIVTVNDNVTDTVNVIKKKKNIAAISSTAERSKLFYDSLIPFTERHGKERLRAFFNYWTELNKSGTKMRFELERTWELSRRLTTWEGREKINGKEIKQNTVTMPIHY